MMRAILVTALLLHGLAAAAPPGAPKPDRPGKKGADLCHANLSRLWIEHRIKHPSDAVVMDPATFQEWPITEEDMPLTFFTSDHHFGHDRIIAMAKRPFRSTQEMDEKMILKWNETVPVNATVFVNGDFSMNLASVQKILPRLNGVKILVVGNHDLAHPENQKCRTQGDFERFRAQYIEAGFLDVQLGYRMTMPGLAEFNVTHYPYLSLTEAKEEPPAQSGIAYRLADNGRALVCGHVHCAWTVKGNMVNVGVDVNDFKPVAAPELRKMLLELKPPSPRPGKPKP